LTNTTNSFGNPESQCYFETTLKQQTDGKAASECCEKLDRKIKDKRKKLDRHFLENSLNTFNVNDLLRNCKDEPTAITNSCIGSLKRFFSESIFLWNDTEKELNKFCTEGDEELADSDHKAEDSFQRRSNQNPVNQHYTLFHSERNKSTYVVASKPQIEKLTNLAEDSPSDYIPFTRKVNIADDIGYVEIFLDICQILLDVDNWIEVFYGYLFIHVLVYWGLGWPGIRFLPFFSRAKRRKIFFVLHLTVVFCYILCLKSNVILLDCYI
jgi:hypothetical protein